MNANRRELLLQKEVYAVVGCAIVVLNVLVVQQQLIVDTKTIDHITDQERGQMLNYVQITTLPVAIILNFKHARLEWERLVLSGERILDGDKEELML